MGAEIKITLDEVGKIVSFIKDEFGRWIVDDIACNVFGDVGGDVGGADASFRQYRGVYLRRKHGCFVHRAADRGVAGRALRHLGDVRAELHLDFPLRNLKKRHQKLKRILS